MCDTHFCFVSIFIHTLEYIKYIYISKISLVLFEKNIHGALTKYVCSVKKLFAHLFFKVHAIENFFCDILKMFICLKSINIL